MLRVPAAHAAARSAPRTSTCASRTGRGAIQQVGNSLTNQFELPVLFYVLTILAIITKHADFLFVVMAWIFVLTRLAHAYIHVTSNNVRPARRCSSASARWCWRSCG